MTDPKLQACAEVLWKALRERTTITHGNGCETFVQISNDTALALAELVITRWKAEEAAADPLRRLAEIINRQHRDAGAIYDYDGEKNAREILRALRPDIEALMAAALTAGLRPIAATSAVMDTMRRLRDAWS